MRIILDENVPFGLLRMLAPRQATTVQQAGFRGLKNGALLAALEGAFDILVTADKNLRYPGHYQILPPVFRQLF